MVVQHHAAPLGEGIFAGHIWGVELADKPENPVIGSASDGNRCSNLAGVSHLGEGSHNVVADTLCDLFCAHIESTGGKNPEQGVPTNEK